jgi:hypothetical protein
LIIISHPAPQGHELRSEPGEGVKDLQDFPEAGGRNLASRTQEIAEYLPATHRHPHQRAHLSHLRKPLREPIGESMEKG